MSDDANDSKTETPRKRGGNPAWVKGQSGNPGGRPRTGHIRVIAQLHTEAAINTLVEICMHGLNEGARVSAALALLDRGYGKPQQTVEIIADDGADLLREQLEQLRANPMHATALLSIAEATSAAQEPS